MGERLRIHEVGLRDGLQGEAVAVPTSAKLALLRSLRGAGLTSFEATSFVSPKAVPQMADAEQVMAGVASDSGARYSALVLNEKGYMRAREAGCRSVAFAWVTTEPLALRNGRMTVAEGLEACRAVMGRARTDDVQRRVYIAPAWVCPYEGPVAEDSVLRRVEEALEAGASEIALADTIGHADPWSVRARCEAVGRRFGFGLLAVHLHDTQALGLANAVAALDAGVRTLDAAIGGIGGCPFAPGAAGNVATEDLVHLAARLGFETGVDGSALAPVVAALDELLGRRVGGRTRAYHQSRKPPYLRSAEERSVPPSSVEPSSVEPSSVEPRSPQTGGET